MKYHKEISLFLFCFAFVLRNWSFGQEYRPMDFENSYWGIERFDPPGDRYEIRYHCEGDTVINDTSFAKMFKSQIKYPVTGSSYTEFLNSYSGAILELSDKTVRCVPSGQGFSEEIIDYNRHIGDTILLRETFFIVKGIDSVEYCGQYYKRYYQETGIFPIALIEGVGYSNGILGFYETHIGEGERTITLECFMYLQNPECQSCGYVLNHPKPDIVNNIYPNPTMDLLTIETSKPISELQVFDLQGKLHLKKELGNSSQVTVNTLGLTPGLYQIRIIYVNGEISYKKILKCKL